MSSHLIKEEKNININPQNIGLEVKFNEMTDAFHSGINISPEQRKAFLKILSINIKNNEQEIYDALKKDLNKPEFESYAMEVASVLEEINFALKNLHKWVNPQSVATPLTQFYSSAKIYPEPYGVCLIISPWNYPFMLALNPLVGAIAAGNCAVLKPSELSPHTTHIISKIIRTTFPENFVCVQEGDLSISQELLKIPFHKIFFTGSTRVGKIVMKAAAENLTPVTLELGGKSPCIVEDSADIAVTAARIAWGKFTNCGQTCIAPDHIWVSEKNFNSLVSALKKNITTFYGTNPEISSDYGRIINDSHFLRLTQYLKDGTILHGGKNNPTNRYIEPTIIKIEELNSQIMQEEIFGPILPILVYQSLEQVKKYINNGPSPLALYLFTNKNDIEKSFIEQIKFGGGCVNDCLVHLSTPELPFGGVGNSGMGSYHGKATFDAFSYQKSVLKKTFFPELSLRYPPYKEKLKLIKKLL